MDPQQVRSVVPGRYHFYDEQWKREHKNKKPNRDKKKKKRRFAYNGELNDYYARPGRERTRKYTDTYR